MATCLIKGRQKYKTQVPKEIETKYYGHLRNLKEQEVRRLIVHLLNIEVLSERFLESNVNGSSLNVFSVYLEPGRRYDELLMNCLEIELGYIRPA